MKIIVLGSPGVGKGTYTQDLVKKLDGVNMITLAFGENEPLKMNFGFHEDAIKVLFLLAPRQDAY